MKKLLLLFILFTSLLSYSQTVTIPDANFKAALIEIGVDTNNDGEIQVSEAEAVTEINVSNKNISSLEGISNFINLSNLNSSTNLLSSLNISNLEELKSLNCWGNQLTILTLPIQSKLESLGCSYNQLVSIDLSNQLDLKQFSCNNNQFISLDVSNQSKLTHFYFDQNYYLETVNMKNGIVEEITLFNCDSLEYICVDPEEQEDVKNYADSRYINAVVNSFCTFQPGGEVYHVKGNVKVDLTGNGCGPLDINFPFLKLKVTNTNNDTGIYSTNSSGEYDIALPAGEYTIEYQFPYSSYFDVTPPNFTVNFPTDVSPFLQDICLTPNGTHNDLQVGIIPIEEARPGFDAKYKVVYANVGTTVLSGNVNLTFDDTVIDFVSASPSVTSQNTGQITWSFTDLAPAEIKIVDITMNLNTPTESPPLTGDEILCYVATITPTDNDEELNDNSFTLKQTVVNSFDPNDKTCLEGNTVTPDLIGEYVHYLIRFENTGTASAINIVVKDIIDTTKFDVSTLEVYNSSHALETRIQNTNEVEFIFEGINLPFDDATNDGYVAFKIKTLPSLAIGDTFENKAEIYFDYNAPIITNNAQTTIETTASLDEFSLNSNIEIFPNPANNLLNIESEIAFDTLVIYDLTGRELSRISLTEPLLKNNFPTNNLVSGVYYLSVQSGKSKKLLKFIKE